MSKGSPIIPVRIPQELLDLVDEAVSRSLDRMTPHTRSSWIIMAIENQLKKQARSAKRESDVPNEYERDQYTR